MTKTKRLADGARATVEMIQSSVLRGYVVRVTEKNDDGLEFDVDHHFEKMWDAIDFKRSFESR